MPSEQGSRTRRLAGSTPLALASLLSLTLHLLVVSFIPRPWPEPPPPIEDAPRLELRLQAPVPQKSPEPATPDLATKTPETADTKIGEIEPDPNQAAEEVSEVPPEPEPRPPQPEQTRTLDFDALVRETVESMEGDEQQAPLGEAESSIGDAAFDPRLRERIRQSEDINTAAPAKKSRVRSWQEPGGDLYVEVGDGSCFHVRQSMQPGVPAAWEFTRCRSGEKLQLNPKPYAEID